MKLKSYSNNWPTLYQKEKEVLEGVIGDNIVAIQHIGSTAIPGMAAKPIIDIAVMLPSMATAKNFIGSLAEVGYIYDEPSSSSERYFFRKDDPMQFHLSLTAPNVSFWRRQMLFRDYLIAHPEKAKEYEELKREAIIKDPTGRKEYLEKKAPFVGEVLALAGQKSGGSIKVFIEQPGTPYKKNVFNKATGELKGAIDFHLTYPYPYGYALDTISADGDNLDCYIITDKKFETGSIVDCEPIGLLEQFEDGKEDHNVLAVVVGERRVVDDNVRKNISHFHEHFYDDRPEKNDNCQTGRFLGKEAAEALIEKCRIK